MAGQDRLPVMGEGFRPMRKDELERADEEVVLREFVAAREAGDVEQMKATTAIFIQRRYGQLISYAQLKLPAQDAEDVVGEAIISAMKSLEPGGGASFSGTTPGELGAWLMQILKRRTVDYYRRDSRQLKADSLDAEFDGEDGAASGKRNEPVALTGDPAGVVAILDAHRRVLDGLSETHALVVNLWLWERLPAAEIAERVRQSDGSGVETAMTVANVHQITRRYRVSMETALDLETGNK